MGAVTDRETAPVCGARLISPWDMEGDSHTVLLGYNHIGAITGLCLQRYRRMEHLDLRSNRISTIHSRAFRYQQNLTYLDLSANQLATIPAELFRPLANLLTLDLGNNRISELPGSALDSSLALDTLYLHNNALTGLAGPLLGNLGNLRHLRLDGNPWACTCQIQTLLNWIKQNPERLEERDRTLCGFPGYLDQYPLLGIQGDSFRQCQNLLSLSAQLYFLCIGLTLCIGSIGLCFAIGSLVVTCQHFQHWRKARPHMYRKSIVTRRDAIIYGHQLPECRT
uniref:Leucine rich repeat containing 26 n=1 Tax=Xenopus tropicalis TaxID=8364 RepID=A0A803J730_XENTR